MKPWTRLPENLILNYTENHLTFQFTGLNFSHAEKTLYKFYLEGFDEEWSPASRKQDATYSNVPPGKYTFYLLAGNEQGLWSPEPDTFSFEIRAPFWQTWWFYVLLFIIISIFIYAVIVSRTQRLNEVKKLLKKKVVERTKEIEEQKNELEKLSIVASKTSNGVIISDKNGKTIWFNESYEKITGYTLEELKGKKPGDFLVKNSKSIPVLEKIREKSAQLNYFREEIEIVTKDGRDVWIEISNTPVLNKSGTLKTQIEIITDITNRRHAEDEIKRKNKEITESILFAKQIQEAVLPQRKTLTDIKPDSFILYMPRDIVSGDFYWFDRVENMLVFAVADCTGHGVPGAFMSMLGNQFLHQLITEPQITSTKEVLRLLDQKLTEALHVEESDGNISKAGIDLALCALNLDSNQLQYSGAYRSAIIIKKGELVELNPEKFSVGVKQKTEKIFSEEIIQLDKDDVIYLFSDGYSDQFGGEKNKKFLMKRFKELLLEVNNLPMSEQRKVLWQRMEEWKGGNRQVDDILVMGIRV